MYLYNRAIVYINPKAKQNYLPKIIKFCVDREITINHVCNDIEKVNIKSGDLCIIHNISQISRDINCLFNFLFNMHFRKCYIAIVDLEAIITPNDIPEKMEFYAMIAQIIHYNDTYIEEDDYHSHKLEYDSCLFIKNMNLKLSDETTEDLDKFINKYQPI